MSKSANKQKLREVINGQLERRAKYYYGVVSAVTRDASGRFITNVRATIDNLTDQAVQIPLGTAVTVGDRIRIKRVGSAVNPTWSYDGLEQSSLEYPSQIDEDATVPTVSIAAIFSSAFVTDRKCVAKITVTSANIRAYYLVAWKRTSSSWDDESNELRIGPFAPAASTTETRFLEVENLVVGTSYDFKVRIEDMQGRKGDYSTSTTKVAGSDSALPAPPTPTVVDIAGDNVKITWTDVYYPDFAGYSVWSASDAIGTGATREGFVYAGLIVTKATDPTYRYWAIKWVTLDGAESNFSSWITDDAAPSAPTGVTAVGLVNSIALEWVNPTDEDFKQINIYANTVDTFGTASGIGSTPDTTYLHADLSAGDSRYYWLVSEDYAGNTSSPTSSIYATTYPIASGIAGNSITQALLRKGAQTYNTTLELTGTAYNAISWGEALIVFGDGSAVTINSGSQGSLTDSTTYWLYIDSSTNPATLTLTTTYSDVISDDNVLLGVVVVATSDDGDAPMILPFTGRIPTMNAQAIAAAAIMSDHITAGQIIGKDFRTDADIGDAGGGTGVRFNASGIAGYSAGTTWEFKLDADTGKGSFGGGQAVLDSSGITLGVSSAETSSYVRFNNEGDDLMAAIYLTPSVSSNGLGIYAASGIVAYTTDGHIYLEAIGTDRDVQVIAELGIDMNNSKIHDMLNPTLAQDAVTLSYMQTYVADAVSGVVASGIISDHGLLTGLGDDDHTIYLLANGTRAMTGDLDPNAPGTLGLGDSTNYWNTIHVTTVNADSVVRKTASDGGSIGSATYQYGAVYSNSYYIGATQIIDATAALVGITVVDQNLIPLADDTYNLGNDTHYWANLFATQISGASNLIFDINRTTGIFFPGNTDAWGMYIGLEDFGAGDVPLIITRRNTSVNTAIIHVNQDYGIEFQAAGYISTTAGNLVLNPAGNVSTTKSITMGEKLQIVDGGGAFPGIEFFNTTPVIIGYIAYGTATDSLIYATANIARLVQSAGAFAFQEATTISTTAGALILDPTTNVETAHTIDLNSAGLSQSIYRTGNGDSETQLLFDFPGVSTAVPRFRVFRTTNTTGSPEFAVYRGDNTTTTLFNVNRTNIYLTPSGWVRIGVEDSYQGLLKLYGNGAGTADGAEIQMCMSADHDSNADFWAIDIYADDLRFFTSNSNANIRLSYEGSLIFNAGTKTIATDSGDLSLDPVGSLIAYTSDFSLNGAGGGNVSFYIDAPTDYEPHAKFLENSDTKYDLYYSSSGDRFNLWSTNIDGIGGDGDIFRVSDGTNDIAFQGGLSVDGAAAPTTGIKLGSGSAISTDSGNLLLSPAGQVVLNATLSLNGYSIYSIGSAGNNIIDSTGIALQTYDSGSSPSTRLVISRGVDTATATWSNITHTGLKVTAGGSIGAATSLTISTDGGDLSLNPSTGIVKANSIERYTASDGGSIGSATYQFGAVYSNSYYVGATQVIDQTRVMLNILFAQQDWKPYSGGTYDLGDATNYWELAYVNTTYTNALDDLNAGDINLNTVLDANTTNGRVVLPVGTDKWAT